MNSFVESTFILKYWIENVIFFSKQFEKESYYEVTSINNKLGKVRIYFKVNTLLFSSLDPWTSYVINWRQK